MPLGGLDYFGVAQTLVIGPGERQCVNVTITDDDSAERVETFTVRLSSSNSELQPFQATVTIMDNDGNTQAVYMYVKHMHGTLSHTENSSFYVMHVLS